MTRALPDPRQLPEGARLVHIGPHKTGSTAIQVALHRGRDALAAHGVRYAGSDHRPRRAGWALGVPGAPIGPPPPPYELWEELAREVAGYGDDRVCISNEDFGRASDDQARQIVTDLGGERVHVVAVARRLDHYLPSQWQERVKAGEPRTYEQWLRPVLGDDSSDPDWRNVWHAHDLAGLLRRWVALVGPDRFTLVCAEEGDHDQLPRTFEALLGLPAGTVVVVPERSNRGLSWSEVELVRELNERARSAGWPREVHREFVQRAVVRALRAQPRSELGPRQPPLPEWAAERVRELGDARVDAIRRSGVRVVGDPENQRVPALAGAPVEVPQLTVSMAASAVESVVAAAVDKERKAEVSPGEPNPRSTTGGLAHRLGRWLRRPR